uniref:Peptidase S1 domain-containing protein n=1 Tax=Ciona savignyi TaxID=51511 RepID=H2ZII6_CIOSA
NYCVLTAVRCSTNNGECEHLCNIHNNAIQCSCHPGYELISNGKNCTDIDECASQNRVCPEPSRPFCVNLKGSFQCSNQSCRAVNGQSNRYQSGTCCQHEIGSTCGGDSVPDERIVGGKSSFLGGWPWMVYILIDGSTLCGGTLIDEYWVVTAAHCFKTATSSTTVKMYFGRLNPYATREQEPHVQIRDAVQLILHEEWDKNRFPYNDIALLRVGTAVRFNQFTNKVCLPNGESPSPGTRCWVTGFGTTAYRGPAAKILREVSLPIVDLNTCARSYTSTSYPIDQQKMLCAGYAQGGRDACQGDSGGPLVCQRCDSCSWYLAGVVSYGKGCATPTYYGVYTNVEKYEQWISSKTDIPVHKNRTFAAGWTLWLSWDQCSTTCAAGSRSRRRSCISGTAGGPGCRGSSEQTESCNTQPSWSVWGEWEPCTVRCGVGERVKSRQCVNGNIGDVGCESSGATITEVKCNTIQCPTWRAWVWSSCTTTCGGGMQSGVRTCNQYGGNVDCEGPQTRTRPCETGPCPRWGEYGTWSDCSASCSGGTRTRTRPCVDGVIGNIGCTSGDETEQQTCNTEVCGTWQQWSSWSQCSKSCNGGTKQSTRQCNGGVVGQGGCPGTSTKTEDCPSRPCPVWSEWSDFSECSKSCERGLRTRNRTCLNGNVGDIGCHVGQPSMNRICNTHACPRFTSFGSWSDCSKTCGNGTSERVRTCRNGVVGDLGCRGHLTQTKACNAQDCPCDYSTWGAWSECSVTCGPGTKNRLRTCTDEQWGTWTACSATCGGGSRSRSRTCLNLSGIGWFSQWSQWSQCTVSCGGGTQTRNRECQSGVQCPPDEFGVEVAEEQPCGNSPCPGVWSQFVESGTCSASCGNGTITMTRECIGGVIGGAGCEGESTMMSPCYMGECVTSWQAWGGWGECNVTCGGGIKSRTR